jgi:hypothetical protein
MPAASAAAARLRHGALELDRRLTEVRPAPVLAFLILVQLALAAWFALRTPHNGWIWYSGGDATSYWTEQYSVGHLQIPQAVVGYGLPVFYAWVPLVAGPSLLTGSAVIVILQVLVLVPLALVLFWAIADRLFGRTYAWAAVTLWVAGPLLLIHGFVPRYHWVFDQLFLAPHWFGLTNMADLPSVVAVLGCALLTLRAVDTTSPNDAVLGGLVGGLAIALKPSNAFFLVAVAVLLVGARRPRQAALWVAAFAPSLLTLAVWKYRGLGYLPVTSSSYQQLHVAAAAGHPLAFTTSKYLPLNWHHLGQELVDLREVFWSLRFLEFVAVAGAFGVIRKAPLKGLFVVVWFVAFGIVKASSVRSDFPSATYFRLAEPGLPAYILLVVGVAFCVPRLGRRARAALATARDARIDVRRVAPAAAVLALLPLLVVVVVRNPSTMHVARDENIVQEAPLTSSLHLAARHNPDGSVVLSWRKPKIGPSRVSYLVYVSTTLSDNGCTPPSRGALECFLNTLTPLATTPSTRFVDPTASRQARWYRVAVVATYQRSKVGGDLMLVSDPALARAVS